MPESRVVSKRTSTVQVDTERVIEWLRELSRISDGHPDFTNADVARTLGKKRAGQELSNLTLRLDFARYLAGLPSISCTAEKPFADAWQQLHRSWKWPVKKMRAAAKAHVWSSRTSISCCRKRSACLMDLGMSLGMTNMPRTTIK